MYHRLHAVGILMVFTVVFTVMSCAHPVAQPRTSVVQSAVVVRPGITVLLEDSLALIRGKRIALLTNQTGIDAHGTSDIDLLRGGEARGAGVRLIKLFSPEHGIRGTEDHEQIASGVDERSGLPVHSLYTNGTIGPPDSLLTDVDAIVFDLQDIGTRTWTYVGELIYTMRAMARHHLALIVLDRPNPITGSHVDGPMLDSALSDPGDPAPGRPGKAYALYPFPLRHGMTMGELARFYNATLGINAPLHVIPMTGWRRTMWFDDTGLPWVKPSPNIPTLTSALTYPALVAFEGSNVSVGRGTGEAFQRFGAPWMDAGAVALRLNGRQLKGVRFVVDSFTPVNPGDDKYNGKRIPGIRIVVSDRDAVETGRLCASILFVLQQVHHDSLRIATRTFDERFGSSAVRAAIMTGTDPNVAMIPQRAKVEDFEWRAGRYKLYR
jgi:uncharacterized protein YbbC (DUF1343 family)